jgi:hypothetical protein
VSSPLDFALERFPLKDDGGRGGFCCVKFPLRGDGAAGFIALCERPPPQADGALASGADGDPAKPDHPQSEGLVVVTVADSVGCGEMGSFRWFWLF